MRRSAPLLVIGALAAAAALAVPSQAANPLPAVQGGRTQAYQAVPYVKPVPPKVASVRYYLTGTTQDEANKLQGQPSATFTTARPTATTDLTQDTSPVAGIASGGSKDQGSAFWTAPFHGTLKGRVTVTWYWSTVDAAAGNGNLIAHLWADAGTAGQKELGNAVTGVSVADGQPHAYTVTIDVKSTPVAGTLRLQGSPRYVDAGQALTAHYGSTSSPSYLELPKGPTPLPALPTTRAVKDTDRLVLSATSLGRYASEPTIGVTKDGHAFMTAASFDGLSPATPRTLIYSTSDANKSWHNVSPLYAGQPVPPTTADPYLYVDPDTGRVFNDDLTAACSFLQWSDDNGKTWSNGNPLACESPVDDHQTVVTGNPIAGLKPTGYPKIVYYCVNKVADSQCARSTDGGTTFTFTGNPAYTGYETPTDSNGGASGLCGGLHGHVITDPAGRLYLPKGHCQRPMLAISEDGGSTWHQSLVSRMLTCCTQTSVASDSAGNLYYLWMGDEDLLPYLAVSRDHGRTWGPALLVAPPGVAAVNFPSISAAGPGHIALSFPGTTQRTPSGARPWNYYVSVSTNALSGRPTFHSATANPLADPIHRGPCLGRCNGMFDFIDVVIAPSTGAAWAAASDTCFVPACIQAEDMATTSHDDANNGQGIGIRELSGPGMR